MNNFSPEYISPTIKNKKQFLLFVTIRINLAKQLFVNHKYIQGYPFGEQNFVFLVKQISLICCNNVVLWNSPIKELYNLTKRNFYKLLSYGDISNAVATW